MLGVPEWYKKCQPVGVVTRLPHDEKSLSVPDRLPLAGWRWVDSPCELCGGRVGQQRVLSNTPDLPAHPDGLYPAVEWPKNDQAAQLWQFDPPYVEWDDKGNTYHWTCVLERLQYDQRCPGSGKYPSKTLHDDYAIMANMARTTSKAAIVTAEEKREYTRKMEMNTNMAHDVPPKQRFMPKSLELTDPPFESDYVPFTPTYSPTSPVYKVAEPEQPPSPPPAPPILDDNTTMINPPEVPVVLLKVSLEDWQKNWKEGYDKSATSSLFPGSIYLITGFDGDTVTLQRMN